MPPAKANDTVRVHYTGKLADGTIFDTSSGQAPLEFVLGAGQMIPGFEAAVLGLNPGESREITLPPDQAYGHRHPHLRFEVERSQFPEGLKPELGQRLSVTGKDGRSAVVTVVDLGERTVTLDGNHPLAGKDLTFFVQLVEILPGSAG
jgi:peptidylprolyl isomerase